MDRSEFEKIVLLSATHLSSEGILQRSAARKWNEMSFMTDLSLLFAKVRTMAM